MPRDSREIYQPTDLTPLALHREYVSWYLAVESLSRGEIVGEWLALQDYYARGLTPSEALTEHRNAY